MKSAKNPARYRAIGTGQRMRGRVRFFPREAARKHLKRELQGPYADRVGAHLAGTPGKPFAAGGHGQIAMKVIDNRGRELLMVSQWSEAEKK